MQLLNEAVCDCGNCFKKLDGSKLKHRLSILAKFPQEQRLRYINLEAQERQEEPEKSFR